MKLMILLMFGVAAILSQSANRYEIIVDHLVLPKRDELFDYGTLRVKKYNRTTFVINGTYDILKPISDELSGQITLYAYQGNEYKKIMERKLAKICTFLQNDKFIVAKTIGQTSLGPEIKSCPLEPQRVHFYDVSWPADFMPLEPPKGEKYRADLLYTLDTNPLDVKVLTNFSAYFLLKKLENDGSTPNDGPKLV